MANRFEKVDEKVPDAITVTFVQRPDGGQWASVHCPASAVPGTLPADLTTPDMPPFEALRGAIQLANDKKLAVVVVDRDNVWKDEWGTLYRWEDEPEAQQQGEPDGNVAST